MQYLLMNATEENTHIECDAVNSVAFGKTFSIININSDK